MSVMSRVTHSEPGLPMGKHQKAQEQLITSNIKTVLLDVMNQLAFNADLE